MIHLTRRQAVLSALALAAGSGVRAQGFPAKPIHIIVGYSAGGAVDIIARAIGQHLQTSLGQPVIVDNKPGAGTNIATKALIDSPPDGHTVMLAANALAANVSLFQPAPYELERIAPIALVGRVPVVLVANAQSSVDSVKALIAQSKAQPESIDYGTPGNGSTPHLAVELFERAAGVRLMHVPYKGGSAAINDVIAARAAHRALIRWRSPLRCDCTALLGPGSRRRTHCAHFVRCVQTPAASQITKRALRTRRPRPCAARRHPNRAQRAALPATSTGGAVRCKDLRAGCKGACGQVAACL